MEEAGGEEEAGEALGGDSKSLIAKYVADHLEVDLETDAGKRLKKLAKSIRDLAAPVEE